MSGCCQERILDTEQLDALLKPYQGQSSALIEVLHQVQDLIGYLPRGVQLKIADTLGVSLSEVYSVVSFYSRFTTKPQGKHKVCMCKGTACYVKGSPEILDRFEKELGIESGDTTNDGKYSLEVVRCLGACGLGPVMTVDGNVHGLLKPDKAISVLKKYK
ncbi:MAG: NAD(P)H-dependent oxidoreductase subunit E [Bacillota bacterium]|jgi:NADH:ubiquinone oxidoreductase subunit E